ncbi:response regulator transcription factor [Pelagerythrobacter marensis]|uniref:Putative transcriptional regulatory protein, LuxR family protein n=1 Tax=Pelagerythrobacter marensis TaxID=543877 RepID=A0A0G3X8H2_9SPHN|nr:LuxR C-terminal-related transcriptional regulator [Pelagerythrobacter marensis]AKM07850.1 putative transcriptional regulatory protein, LuxR family protein [Pelagerythrobacter marensis]
MDASRTLHIVDPDARQRAELARLALAAGRHAEVYGTVGEVADFRPEAGIAVVRDHAPWGGIRAAMAHFTDRYVGLPVLAVAPWPDTAQVVAAIRAGAIDFLPLPLTAAVLRAALVRVQPDAEAHAAAQRRLIDARRRVRALTRREREVLEWLTRGSSNKAIARMLKISPRTVEIHRANMMAKLGARHPAEAVRICLETQP